MSKLGFWVAVSVVSLGAAVGAWYYKYQLYGWLPSTASSELKNVDGLLMDKEGKPFTGRVKDISDSGYSLYGSSSKALFNFAPRELLSITQAKFLCKRLFRVLLKSFLMPIKTASLTDSMWSSVKVNFVRSDIGKMASKMAFLKPGQTKVC